MQLLIIDFGKIENYSPVTTGNVNVFDIDIDCNCKNGETDKPQSEDKNILGKVFIDDANGNYIYQQELDIFKNAAFNYENKIAPGVSNTYHFVVHNSSDINLKYYVEMYENTEYQINLKYRLKRNNKYVIGNEEEWVTASELKTNFNKINFSTSDSYSLDWKWFDDDKQDTIVGKNMTSKYKLNVRFHFEQV